MIYIKIYENNLLVTILLSQFILLTILIGSDMKNTTDKMTSIVNSNGLIRNYYRGVYFGGYKIRGFCTNP
ncbi:Hsp33 family molecular chaperone HslO [Spiroplasma endosymbiont of Polydrusus formosus]|uniref:Hsp33 family molecular chaperone HslO n=1 Tax=Spiroplasma endosymbiont of Polydrusus formosus TaxID=3139326 RepID=UPI0035B50DC1